MQTPVGMTPESKIMMSAKLNLSLNYKDIADQGDEDDDALEKLRFIRAQEQQANKKVSQSIVRPISDRIKTPLNDW